MTVKQTADTLTIEGEFAYQSYFTWTDVERFEFADGTIWTKQTIQERRLHFHTSRINEPLDTLNPAVNSFLEQARTFMLQQLRDGDKAARIGALLGFQNVLYPGDAGLVVGGAPAFGAVNFGSFAWPGAQGQQHDRTGLAER